MVFPGRNVRTLAKATVANATKTTSSAVAVIFISLFGVAIEYAPQFTDAGGMSFWRDLQGSSKYLTTFVDKASQAARRAGEAMKSAQGALEQASLDRLQRAENKAAPPGDLDMTYISDRVISASHLAVNLCSWAERLTNPVFAVIGFPGPIPGRRPGREADVAAYLERKHRGQYMIWNFSEEAYDYAPFDNQVRGRELRSMPPRSPDSGRPGRAAGDGLQVPRPSRAAAGPILQVGVLHRVMAARGRAQRGRGALLHRQGPLGNCGCLLPGLERGVQQPH